jgi:VCBS repeat-containing protein
LVVTDADAGQSSWQTSTQTSVYGQLALDANGLWTYTLNNTALAVQELNTGDSRADTYTLHTFDGTAYTVSVNVNGKSEPVAPAPSVSTTTAPTSNATPSASTGGVSTNNGGMAVTTAVTTATTSSNGASGGTSGTAGSAQTAVVTSMTGGATQFFQPVNAPVTQPTSPAPSMAGGSGAGFNAIPVNTALGSGVSGLGLGMGGFATAGSTGVNLGDIAGATAKDDKRQQGTITGTAPVTNAPVETVLQPQGGVPAQPSTSNAPAPQSTDVQPQTPADVPTQPVGPQSANEANQMDDALALAATVAQMAALSTRPGRILWGTGV